MEFSSSSASISPVTEKYERSNEFVNHPKQCSNEICCTCLKNGTLNSIYRPTYCDLSVYTLLKIHLSFEIKDHMFPENVCENCENMIVKIHIFKMQCIQSWEKLSNGLSFIKGIIKSEPETEFLPPDFPTEELIEESKIICESSVIKEENQQVDICKNNVKSLFQLNDLENEPINDNKPQIFKHTCYDNMKDNRVKGEENYEENYKTDGQYLAKEELEFDDVWENVRDVTATENQNSTNESFGIQEHEEVPTKLNGILKQCKNDNENNHQNNTTVNVYNLKPKNIKRKRVCFLLDEPEETEISDEENCSIFKKKYKIKEEELSWETIPQDDVSVIDENNFSDNDITLPCSVGFEPQRDLSSCNSSEIKECIPNAHIKKESVLSFCETSEAEDNFEVEENVDKNSNFASYLNTVPSRYQGSELNANINELETSPLFTDSLEDKATIFLKGSKLQFLNNKKMKHEREKNFCLFCKKLVLFSRHLIRHHAEEGEVKNIILKPVNSRERKLMLTVLRKKGNYQGKSEGFLKPMKRTSTVRKFLPCKYCLGYYSHNFLWKHRRKCGQNNEKRTNVQAEAQNFMLENLKVSPELKEVVFPHMRGDDISFLAKTDHLICACGMRQLGHRRKKHFINLVSRKMRELAKLLMEVRKSEPTIMSLTDALQPEWYHLLVQAVKTVAKYDSEKNTYNSYSFVSSVTSSLKQCCNIAICFALNKSASPEAEKLRITWHLLNENWKVDVLLQPPNNVSQKTNINVTDNRKNSFSSSSLSSPSLSCPSSLSSSACTCSPLSPSYTFKNRIERANCSSAGTSTKMTLLQLTICFKLFQRHITTKIDESFEKLKADERDYQAYISLMESVFCRFLLLNRKHPRELQTFPLYLYKKIRLQQDHEELDLDVIPTEKILLQKFKCIAQNKRIPTFFSDDNQKYLELLLKVRHNFVPERNIFLFGNPNMTAPINGLKVLQRYFKECEINCPELITSPILRKHLTILSHLVYMIEEDVRQLILSMGITPGTYIPGNLKCMAKICGLLLMEQTDIDSYIGRNLDEIDIDLYKEIEFRESQIRRSELEWKENFDKPQRQVCVNNVCAKNGRHELEYKENVDKPRNVCVGKVCFESDENAINNKQEIYSKERSVVKASNNFELNESQIGYKKRVLVPWTDEQKKLVHIFFKNHIALKKPPKKCECDVLINQNPGIFHNKSWLKIKVYVQNVYTNKTK